MKKIITFIFMFPVSLLMIHEAASQSAARSGISRSVYFFESSPIRDMRIILPGEQPEKQRAIPNYFSRYVEESDYSPIPGDKPLLQQHQGNRKSRGPLLNFEGVGNVSGTYPADPNGDVGPDHYVQIVNRAFAIWDKSGNMIYGPVDYQTIWASFPGPWNTYIWCDPIIKYDQLADRWVMLSMSHDFNVSYTMIAVSSTPDPLGSYYCYAYFFENLNDYPKLSVWPDGYYMTCNFWDYQAGLFLYTLYSVVDRDTMLSGASTANMIQFQVQDPGEGFFFPMPADCRGTLVPMDTACYFITIGRHDLWNPWHLYLDVHAFHADWNIPANSTFEEVSQFDIGQYEPINLLFGSGSPQFGSNINVMTIPIFMMYPLTYRMFGDHETMVCSQTMWDGELHYIKWYELRKDSADWYIYQTGNYAPGNAHYFFPSISVNALGDIAMGYSVCNEIMYPSIRFTGRRAADTLGIMTFQEIELFKGLNPANTYDAYYNQNRWGDYSSMMVDPSDDSTFWYTNMYTKATSNIGNWVTRIFSINLSEDIVLPYAFAGNDTLNYNILFFETQGEAENYSSILWTTSGDGHFMTNYAEDVIYLRGPGDLDSGQVSLTMHLTGYYPGTTASDSMILYLLPVGIPAEPEPGPEITVYPNPAENIITLSAKIAVNEPLTVQIVTGQGNVLFTGNYIPSNEQFELSFDLSHLPSGVYFYQLRAKGIGQVATGKILKH